MTRTRRKPKPLDPPALEELALLYVARFATTRAKLEAYLARKLRERGWTQEEGPHVERIAERMVEAGYVDDAAYAAAKASGLVRRGYGMRRVSQALAAAGVTDALQDDGAPGEADLRGAAVTLARKRGFGPFGVHEPDRAQRQKQIAAMLRAGHAMDHVLQVIDCGDANSLVDWIVEAQDTP